ncbi:MAG: Methionine aminopeptidase [Parcubacteria group bacterium GW2011_GWA1_47_8]|nr:MAG: Methionine aminopeptidase [Parcubacteria group bacterium GW2011_GWA1_47_8]
MIKTKEEIEVIRECGRRLARVLEEVKNAVRPGVTTQELNDLAERLIRAGGDEPAFLQYQPDGVRRPYPGTLCVSVNNEIVHGIGDPRRVLKEGDIIGIDLGIKHKGLFTDAALTVPVGVIDENAKKLIDTTREALQRGIAEARAGKTTGDVGYVIEKYVQEQGFVVVEELGGHGVGYRQHEDPHIANYGERGQGIRLKAGMVLALEPIVNEGTRFIKLLPDDYTYVTRDGKRSGHFEHTILVTDGASEILTKI